MTLPRPGMKGFEKLAATIKPDPNKRLVVSDPDTRGLYLRVTPAGAKSWTIVARNPAGKQVWVVAGDYDDLSLEEARQSAREAVKRIKRGEPPFPKIEPPKVLSFQSVHDNFIQRYVDQKGLLSAAETKRIFQKYVLPRWKDRPFKEIDREDVASLLDDIEDGRLEAPEGTKFRGGGAVMADRVLAALSKLFAWHATRDSKYSSPIVRGMGRSAARERARDRVLTDHELRLFWSTAEASGGFGAFLQTCLLTGQRRAKVTAIRWEDVNKSGVWTIAPDEPIGDDDTEAERDRKIKAAKREKANAGSLKLPKLAHDIIRAQPAVKDNPYVFAGRGKSAMDPGDKPKKHFDAKLAEANNGEALAPWTIHDLRRTAKTLMQRAGVRPDVSERVLGHVIAGVEGIYGRHDYESEKGKALVKLAALVEKIIRPPTGNVVAFPKTAHG